MTRIAFLGTPEAAVPTLEALAATFDVGLVVTRPDRPRGRSGAPAPSPVKSAAIELGLEVAQPATGSEISAVLIEAGPFDLGVVVAYGMILGPDVLAVPGHGILNLHFSLLPRWRGAAPVARALMAGDTMTGVTVIRIDEGLDTGPVLTAQALSVGAEETAGELTERLAAVGARLLADLVPGYLGGEVVPVAQSDQGLTYAHKITPDERILDSRVAPEEFVARVRALSPEPGAVLAIDGLPHQVLAARVAGEEVDPGAWAIVAGAPVVGLAGGSVELVELQPPGKRPMAGRAWARGLRRRHGVLD